MGIIPIIVRKRFFSCACEDTYLFPLLNLPFKLVLKADSNKFFIPYSTKLNYGDCSLTVERVVVVRKTRVQLPSFTLMGFFFRKKETTLVEKTMNGKFRKFSNMEEKRE